MLFRVFVGNFAHGLARLAALQGVCGVAHDAARRSGAGRAAADARKSILAGKKVAFLCKAGLNRSPTLARMASHGMNIVGVAMPVDEALCELALCDLEDPSALAKLTPVGVRKQRKRSRPDA